MSRPPGVDPRRRPYHRRRLRCPRRERRGACCVRTASALPSASIPTWRTASVRRRWTQPDAEGNVQRHRWQGQWWRTEGIGFDQPEPDGVVQGPGEWAGRAQHVDDPRMSPKKRPFNKLKSIQGPSTTDQNRQTCRASRSLKINFC